jgi:hypothetical protein
MLKCPVCGTENGDLELVCSSCKGFVQAKVDALDLFHTAWGLLETPRRTFRRIGLSRNKNYVIPLSAMFGVAVVFVYLWHWTMAVRIPSLVTLLGIGVLIGPPLGNLMIAVFANVARFILRFGGAALSFRNAFAIIAYAGIPIVATVVLVLPLELGIFGTYFFDINPPPIMLNPAAYIGLLGLNAVAVIWSVALCIVGLRSATDARWLWPIVAAVCIAGICTLLVIGIRPR